MQDLSSSGSHHLALSSRGVGRREKMQAELAPDPQLLSGCPATLVPPDESGKSRPKDLGRTWFGRCVNDWISRTLWGVQECQRCRAQLVGAVHAMDCAAEGDFVGTREYLALLCAALHLQSALDGSWSLAWVLTLLDDPPVMLFADRMQPVVAHRRRLLLRYSFGLRLPWPIFARSKC